VSGNQQFIISLLNLAVKVLEILLPAFAAWHVPQPPWVNKTK
jgi:hypothetical protein